MRRQSLLLCVGVLISLIGFAWMASQGQNTASEVSLARAPTTPAGGVTEQALPAPGKGPGVSSQESQGLLTAREALAVESPLAREREPKRRSIEGHVLDSLGVPVAGARIYCAPRSTFSGASLQAIVESGSDLLSVAQTLSGEHGEFQLDCEARGELEFELHAAGFASLRVRREVRGGDVVQLEDLILLPGLMITGRVEDAKGNGLAGVTIHEIAQQKGGVVVQLMGDARPVLASTALGGRFEIEGLSPGPFALQLVHPEYPSLRVDGTLSSGSRALTDQLYVMEVGHVIRGLVRGLEGGDHARYRVRATPGESQAEPFLNSDRGLRLGAITADGQFEVRGLREGSYDLQLVDGDASPASFAVGRSAVVRVASGTQHTELALRAPTGLAFQVLDDDSGLPRTTFTVKYGQSWMSTLRDGEQEPLLEHPEGRVRIEDLTLQGNSSSTSLEILVEGCPPLRLNDIALLPGEVLELGSLRVSRLPLIRVQVFDDNTGEPVEAAWVALEEMPDASVPGGRQMSFSFGADEDEDDEGETSSPMLARPANRAKSNGQGIALVPSLPGKLCQLKITQREYAPYVEPNILLPERGDDELEARLVQGGTVVVTVLSAQGERRAGVGVRERLLDSQGPRIMGGPGARKTRADGSVTFKHMAPGAHEFRIAGSGGGAFITTNTEIVFGTGEALAPSSAQVVEVNEGEVSNVTLHARPEGNFRGTLTEGGAPLPGAQLSFSEVSPGAPSSGMGGMQIFGMGGGLSTRSDGEGDFLQTGLKTGRYTLTITHPARAMGSEFEVEIAEGNNTRNFNLDSSILEGRVLDSDGKPVAGVRVRPERYVPAAEGATQSTQVMTMMIVDSGGGGMMSVSSGTPEGPAVLTDEDGRYSLRGVLSEVELVVTSRASRYQDAKSKPVQVGRDQTRANVDLEIFEAGALRVLLRNSDGSVAINCLAEFEYVGQADPRPEAGREFIGESGETTLQSLRPGIWSVSAHGLGGFMGGAEAPAQRSAEAVEIEVRPGETQEVLLEVIRE